MTTKLVPTDEQAAIIAAVADPAGGSIMTEAYAGTAKTSTLEMAAPGIRQPALAVAFNKAIAKELQPRLPAHFSVKTFNGLGYGAWMRANPSINRWELDERKLGKIVSSLAKDRKVSLSSDQWEQARKLTSAAMAQGLSPGNIGTPLVEDNSETWAALADACWIVGDDVELLVDFAREALINDIDLAKRGTISFDDQVYCSVVLGGSFARYPVVFVDEAQDLSPLNHSMLQRSLAEKGRMIVVGDSRQAIYQFRGADSESMGNLRKLQPTWTDKRLTLTFRCPKAIVARQQEHAPGYRAAEGNAEGIFRQFARPETDVQDWNGWGIKDLSSNSAVLCRNNAPILSLAFKLIRGGTGVRVLGRDIGKGLTALARKICPEDHTPADRCAAAIGDWMTREESLARANGKEEKVSGIRDKGESLLACLEGSQARTAGELREVIKQLFEREVGQVTLSTIHRAKGLEWETVVHLDPWRIPSKFARKAAAEGDYSQLRQEYNLRYVAETRTRYTLINANLEDFNG